MVAPAPAVGELVPDGWQTPTRREQRKTGTVNGWDNDVNWNAHDDEFMCGWESWHSNWHEDRKHKLFACSYNAYKNKLSPMTRGDSYQSGWCNDWDAHGQCECRPGYAMTGVYSKHDDWKEDRRWKITCSKIEGLQVTNQCRWNPRYLNAFDGHLYYRETQPNFVMTGLGTNHKNRYEDREHRFKVCAVRVPVHLCDNIEIQINDFSPMTVGNPKTVWGAEWSNDNCEGDTTLKFSLDKTLSTSVATSSTYTLAKTLQSTFNFGISQKATASITAKFGGFGGKFSSSFGIKSSWGSSVTTSTTSSTTEKTVQVETLKAGMMVLLKPHSRNVVKSNYRLYDGYIKWSGVASCYIGEEVASKKDVKGEWRGKAASVGTGSYKVVTEKCGVPPPPGPPEPNCINMASWSECQGWKQAGNCESSSAAVKAFMKETCPKHCDPACAK